MKNLIIIICMLFCPYCYAQAVLDFTQCEEGQLSLDGLYQSEHVLIIDECVSRPDYLPFVNVQIGDSIFLYGENIIMIESGKKIRSLSSLDYQEALFIGEPALDPSAAILDSSGKFLYALGSKVDGVMRINYVEKTDFLTGEVLDSISVDTRCRIALDGDDNLIIAKDATVTQSDLISEYDLRLPDSYFLYFHPRHSGAWTYFICWSNKDRNFRYYLYDSEKKSLKQITSVIFGGQEHPADGLLGFSDKYLAYQIPDTNTKKTEVHFFLLK